MTATATATPTLTPPVGRVMLVDDNSADNIYHQLIFAEVAPTIEVVSVSGGQEALAYLDDLQHGPTGDVEEAMPDWIFVDLNMPAMTGWEFIAAYEQRTRTSAETEIMVLSTTADPTEVRRANGHPAVSRFLSKPLDRPKLDRLLAGRRN